MRLFIYLSKNDLNFTFDPCLRALVFALLAQGLCG